MRGLLVGVETESPLFQIYMSKASDQAVTSQFSADQLNGRIVRVSVSGYRLIESRFDAVQMGDRLVIKFSYAVALNQARVHVLTQKEADTIRLVDEVKGICAVECHAPLWGPGAG